MTIALLYDSDLARVRITLSDYPDGSVEIQRSVNQLYWETVRGGIAFPVQAAGSTLDDHEFVDLVPNFYRVLAVDPSAGLFLPGPTGGGFASTPDAAALDITGDIDLRADVTLDDWVPATAQGLLGKFVTTGNQRSYLLRIDTDGQVEVVWTTDGTSGTQLVVDSTVPVDAENGTRLAVRVTIDVDNGAGGRTVTFYTAPTMDGPWTQLGDPGTGGTTSIFASNVDLIAGAWGTGTTERMTGVLHAVEVRNGIDGTAVANPNFAAQTNGDTSFVDGAGRTWTINPVAQIIGEVIESDSITPDLEGEYWLKDLRYTFLNRIIECLNHGDVQRAARLGLFQVRGRSFPVAVTDLRASPTFTLEILTRTLEEARDMDLILASAQTMLVQVPNEDPANCEKVMAVPGGYVEIGNSVQRRTVPGSTAYVWSLPCTVVAPPGPDVVGTTMNWGTVFNLYGNWQSLISANPTWADLLATVGSPDDLVVP